MSKRETYQAARDRLFRELPSVGNYTGVTYNMGHVLKEPYLLYDSRAGTRKIKFGPQAVRDADSGFSLWIEVRGMSAADFDAAVRRFYAS